MTTVAIVEDNPGIRRSIQEWLNASPDCRCVLACEDAETALKEIPVVKPDIVLMDIQLPGESGIACTARLKSLMPSLQVIVVTVYRDRERLFQALKAGACGYLLKRSTPEELLRAIAEVRNGGAPMTGEIARMVVETFQTPATQTAAPPQLTQREADILDLISKGLANKQIGATLDISYDTVRAHLRRVYQKLHVRCRAEAVTKYLHEKV